MMCCNIIPKLIYKYIATVVCSLGGQVVSVWEVRGLDGYLTNVSAGW